MTHKQIFRVLNVALLAGSALLIVGLFSFAGPCSHDDGSLSTCFNSATGIGGAALFLAGVAIFGLFDVTPTVRIILGVLGLALGLFVAFAPGNLLPLCMMETMQCRAVMQPFALLLGIVLAVLSAAQGILGFRIR
ncbi:MAG: DUF4418 family protein [Coriobacteriaceae bacterium]|nr:DUF4418 family protein [Coriobacteriaceae bacterium]